MKFESQILASTKQQLYLHIFTTHHRNNDILVISGFIFMQIEENKKAHNCIVSKFPALELFNDFPLDLE